MPSTPADYAGHTTDYLGDYMQSSRPEDARAQRDAYQTQHERLAFEAGYRHAHGIACHCAPRIGEVLDTEDGPERVTADNALELHHYRCLEIEESARCFTPWEQTAATLNSLDETEQGEAWEAYDEGVNAAITHDLLDTEYDTM